MEVVGEGGKIYFLNGPLVMQPPPSPEGRKICPPPATLPLCCRNAPLPLIEVSDPSNTADLFGVRAKVPQFQYCVYVSRPFFCS